MPSPFPFDAPRAGLSRLRVARILCGAPHQGRLLAGTTIMRCALGRAGISSNKREGDGATPRGSWKLLYAFMRPARFPRPLPLAPTRRTQTSDIWCDDPESFLYNRHLRRPTRFRHEQLWRSDRLYDFVGVLDYNLRPARRGRGSAIFLHVATEELSATAGCVALRARDLARLIPRLARGVTLRAL